MIEESQHAATAEASDHEVTEARCECGQLVAKLGVGGVELKCKRCKRLVSIPFKVLQESPVTVQLCAPPQTSSASSS